VIKQCSRKSASLAASGRRSAAFCGAFVDVSAVELGKAAVERSGVKPEDVQTMMEEGQQMLLCENPAGPVCKVSSVATQHIQPHA